jgi:hypothetical protein
MTCFTLNGGYLIGSKFIQDFLQLHKSLFICFLIDESLASCVQIENIFILTVRVLGTLFYQYNKKVLEKAIRG